MQYIQELLSGWVGAVNDHDREEKFEIYLQESWTEFAGSFQNTIELLYIANM